MSPRGSSVNVQPCARGALGTAAGRFSGTPNHQEMN